MKTKTGAVIRKIAGSGSKIFNDRLLDGRRSIKVPGWKMENYQDAKRELERNGLKVSMVVHTWFCVSADRYFVQPRLHVFENKVV